MADGKTSLPTISIVKDCLAGISKALTTPSKKAKIATAKTVTWPVKIKVPKIKARVIAPMLVKIRSCLVWNLSTITPPKSPKSKTGKNPKAVTTPTQKAELVSCKTSHDSATSWSQVPTSETSWPKK